MACADLLSKEGCIARELPGYEPRPQQIEMAGAVADAFEAGEHLLVEAGTGVGKSFAYLIPAIDRVMNNGGRVVISTHTIALQEQLFNKDIPFLRSALGKDFSAVLVKGRSNYVGLRRLTRSSAKQDKLFDTKGQRSELWALEDWAYKTADGSLADLSRQPDPSVWERVRSDGDDCFGRKCAHYAKCFYQRARKEAAAAQLLIVNHALLFSDLAVRQQAAGETLPAEKESVDQRDDKRANGASPGSGPAAQGDAAPRGVHASILPDYDYLILDEAHTVERVAGEHMGFGTSSTQVHHLLNMLFNEKTQRGAVATKPGKPVIRLVAQVRGVAAVYFANLMAWFVSQGNFNGRLREPPPVDQGLSHGLIDLRDGIRELREGMVDEEDRSELSSLMERCKAISIAVENWHEQRGVDWVYWMSPQNPRARGDARPSSGLPGRVTLSARPIDIGPQLRAQLFDRLRSVVLTSATLTSGTDDPFAYMSSRLCLDDATKLILGSPFNFREQLTTYVERSMPNPSNGAVFTEAACTAISKYVRKTDGGAFVLFTSYSMLRDCAERLASFFEDQQMPFFVHGAGVPRTLMLDQFRATQRGVLFGTDTFWTGVDVPGPALRNVIIVKLPFAVPNEPMTEARIERIRETGGNPFMDFQVPEAVLKFRQGVGRLIRTQNDTGIVAILDPRVRTKPYGRRFLGALPDCEVVVE